MTRPELRNASSRARVHEFAVCDASAHWRTAAVPSSAVSMRALPRLVVAQCALPARSTSHDLLPKLLIHPRRCLCSPHALSPIIYSCARTDKAVLAPRASTSASADHHFVCSRSPVQRSLARRSRCASAPDAHELGALCCRLSHLSAQHHREHPKLELDASAASVPVDQIAVVTAPANSTRPPSLPPALMLCKSQAGRLSVLTAVENARAAVSRAECSAHSSGRWGCELVPSVC